MPEYIVDCEEVPYGEGKTLVLPVSISSHVHERLIRCRDCGHLGTVPSAFPGNPWFICKIRTEHHFITSLYGYCDHAVPRSDDGERT